MRDIIANIIDPHSFLQDNSGDDLIGEMVRQGKQDALRKADRVIAALSTTTGLPEEPKRSPLDGSEMKFGNCHQCGSRDNLGRSGDDLICGSCSDANYLAEWIDYARALRRSIDPPPAESLRVKPLEWRALAITDREASVADSIFGKWEVWQFPNGSTYIMKPGEHQGTVYEDSYDEAKAYMERVYQRRIAPALATEGSAE